ncbi:MAG TPA: hypothetical protein VGI81_29330 [Tepidisphaeraceae bacterium]|jgi:tetratricopeptide (TPR) repeat protein
MQRCDDSAYEHYDCAMRASRNNYRFAEAEQHFLRAIKLAEPEGPNFTLANALIGYGSLLIRMGRIDEGVALIERRLAMPRFNGEDVLERRCTTEHLAAFKADRDAGRKTT